MKKTIRRVFCRESLHPGGEFQNQVDLQAAFPVKCYLVLCNGTPHELALLFQLDYKLLKGKESEFYFFLNAPYSLAQKYINLPSKMLALECRDICFFTADIVQNCRVTYCCSNLSYHKDKWNTIFLVQKAQSAYLVSGLVKQEFICSKWVDQEGLTSTLPWSRFTSSSRCTTWDLSLGTHLGL